MLIEYGFNKYASAQDRAAQILSGKVHPGKMFKWLGLTERAAKNAGHNAIGARHFGQLKEKVTADWAKPYYQRTAKEWTALEDKALAAREILTKAIRSMNQYVD